MQEQARADAAESALREQSAAALDQQKQWSAAVAGIGEGSEQLELELAQTQQALADARQEIMCAELGSPLTARLPLNLRSQSAAKAEAANAPLQCRTRCADGRCRRRKHASRRRWLAGGCALGSRGRVLWPLVGSTASIHSAPQET